MAERHHRALPHDEGSAEGKIQRLGVHRDTLSSNVYAQTNWWAPIYSATASHTIVFYPTCLTRPVENTSASWDLEELWAGRNVDGSALRTALEWFHQVDDRVPLTGAIASIQGQASHE